MPPLRWPRRSDWDPVALGHLILRDHLAAERTYLANERTLLAYVRTALALVAGGVTLLHFFDYAAADVSGVALVVLGLAAFGFGARRFFRVHRRVATYYRREVEQAAAAAGTVGEENGEEGAAGGEK
ncbi:MAG TPA: DUF202 domain-containing protein [Rubricoccaceae bacterium]|nr:DUF202 domain-containing protein [Rubricoccaceae bacterium]